MPALPAGAVAIAGPHPLLGGDLDNNVVAGLTAGLARRGLHDPGVQLPRGRPEHRARPRTSGDHLAEFWATSHVAAEPGYRDDLVAAAAYLRDHRRRRHAGGPGRVQLRLLAPAGRRGRPAGRWS